MDGERAEPHSASEPENPTASAIEERLAKLAVREGDVVLDKYRLVALLAASNTGAVFLATHTELGHEVAVKLLLEPFAHDAETRARFQREAKLMSRIESDHVARVIDVGELPDETPLIAMECLRGEDLKRVLSNHRNGIDATRAVDLVIQACVGLASAHSRGIVHRDIKPSNLFVAEREDGEKLLKIIDFGVAKMRSGPASLSDALTKPETLVGSPRYMAPEQITSARDVDARADIWALAAILQELITGKPVFAMRGVSNVLRAIVSGPAPSLVEVSPAQSPELSHVIAQALTKDREERFQNVAAFARALAPFGSVGSMPLVERAERILGVASPPPESSGPVLDPYPTEPATAVFDDAQPVSSRRGMPPVKVLAPAPPVRYRPRAGIGRHVARALRRESVPPLVWIAIAGAGALILLAFVVVLWLLFRDG